MCLWCFSLCIFVISAQKPLGLLSLLDEESTFPNGTDLTFANKLKQHLGPNSSFRGERGKAFTVGHYAGEVFTWHRQLIVICFLLLLQLLFNFNYLCKLSSLDTMRIVATHWPLTWFDQLFLIFFSHFCDGFITWSC